MKKPLVYIYVFCGFLFCSPFFSCGKDYVLEKEPNNTFANANPAHLKGSIRGFIDTAIDRDIYFLRVDRAGCIDLHLSGIKGVNLAVKVWRAGADGGAPVLIKVIDDSRKSSPERMANLAVAPGTYYFEITHGDRDAPAASAESAYELTLKRRDSFREELEPNDSMNNATPFAIGKEITGFFSPSFNKTQQTDREPPREEDWYSIEVREGAALPVVIDVTLSGVAGVNSVLSIVDSKGREIAAADNGLGGEGEEIRATGLSEKGIYYIVVSTRGAQSNHEEPYVLKAAAKEIDAGNEIERNDSPDTANVIANDTVSGRIDRKDDVDCFVCRGRAGKGPVRIELRNSEGLDARLELYTRRGTAPVEIETAGRGGRDVHPNFSPSGDFFLCVSSRGRDLPATRDYVLSVTPLTETRGIEIEPNDDRGSANVLEGGTVRGYISSREDRDFFLVSIDRRAKVALEIRGVKGGEIRVSITDPLGYALKSVEVKNDETIVLSETVDRKGYVIVEPLKLNHDYPYSITVKGLR